MQDEELKPSGSASDTEVDNDEDYLKMSKKFLEKENPGLHAVMERIKKESNALNEETTPED